MQDFPKDSTELAQLIKSRLPQPIPWQDSDSSARLAKAVDHVYDQLVEFGTGHFLPHFCAELSKLSYEMLGCLQSDNPQFKAAWTFRVVSLLLAKAGLTIRTNPDPVPGREWSQQKFNELTSGTPDYREIRHFFQENWHWLRLPR